MKKKKKKKSKKEAPKVQLEKISSDLIEKHEAEELIKTTAMPKK